MSKNLIAYTDGSCYPPPNGPMQIGILLLEDDKIVKEISEQIAEKGTNNTAEYRAIIRALEEALSLGADYIEIRSDSQLVIMQLNGLYEVKKPHLKIYYNAIKSLEPKFKKVTYRWVEREQNKYADRLSKLK
ncbi:MAG: ribonuclease HI family protein [Thermoplasmata archaeon]